MIFESKLFLQILMYAYLGKIMINFSNEDKTYY